MSKKVGLPFAPKGHSEVTRKGTRVHCERKGTLIDVFKPKNVGTHQLNYMPWFKREGVFREFLHKAANEGTGHPVLNY